MNKFEMFSLRNGGNLIIALTDPEGDGSNTRVLFVLFVLILLIVFLLIGLFLSIRSCIAYDKKVRQHIYRLVNSQISVTPDDFLKLREQYKLPDGEGVYVIHNTTRDLYYVGQSIHVINRLSQHFCGRGNGDVYADYVYQNEFRIFIIPLVKSGYSTLNALEKDTIAAYHAYDKGYNRTRGNKN